MSFMINVVIALVVTLFVYSGSALVVWVMMGYDRLERKIQVWINVILSFIFFSAIALWFIRGFQTMG